MKEAGKGGAGRDELSLGSVSTELAKFAADFEAKILSQVRIARSANDEILAIQAASPGTVRDPEWEGVVDGEVCGLGVLADSVRAFLHWVPIKLETTDALRLCVTCGDALAWEGEFACARDYFYQYVSSTCKEIEHNRAVMAGVAKDAPVEGAGRRTPTRLTRDEACWAAMADFGVASMELRLALTRDPHVRFPVTLSRVINHLQRAQRGMELLLSLPQEEHESVSWLVLEGTVLVFDWCEPLTVLGHGGSVAEFLAWGILAMESMINLSTVKYLPWRTRLAAVTCYAFEGAGKPEAAARCAAHAMQKVSELRRQEGMDPPIPPLVLETIGAAEADLNVLCFKYTALNVAISKRPTVLDESEGVDGGTGVDGGALKEGESLSDKDVLTLLEQNIPDEKQHPAALLELLGACVSSGGGPGTLTTREASVVCKSAVAMLLPEENALADGGADAPQGGKTETGGEGRDPHGKGAETEDDVALALKPFPLDVDQEMELMREVYRLGEFDSLDLLLPATKQRLQRAQGSCARDDCRAFWFEIALWTACRRLSAWKVKPERQTASRGGLKRVAPGEDTIGNSGAGEDKAKPEGTEAAPVSDSGLAEGDAGPEISNQDPAVEEEKELRDALTGMRPAEVVEIALEGEAAAAARINLTPLLVLADLVRKALFGCYRHVLERRGDCVVDAVMSMWEPYVVSILRALDGMAGGAEVDRSLLDALLLSLETIHACLSVLNVDDACLRATVALRLAILQADFRGDHRKACQTLRSALAGIDKHRQDLTSHHLHVATDSRSRDHSDFKEWVRLGRMSVTASFHEQRPLQDHTHKRHVINGSTKATTNGDHKGGRREGVGEMTYHELAALQLEITSTLFRVELLMGRDVACNLAKHQKAEKRAKAAARRNASKQKGGSNKVSKVTFGVSDGLIGTPDGSLGVGWSVALPPNTSGREINALAGPNDIVCAAGAGHLPSMAVTMDSLKRDTGKRLADAVQGVDGPDAREGEPQAESCAVTEARLTSEFRRNPYARAVLLVSMARFRTDRRGQEALLTEAASFLRQARTTEESLLDCLPVSTAAAMSPTTTSGRASPTQASGTGTPASSTQENKNSIFPTATPPPPFLLSRSHSSVELLPAPFAVSSSGYPEARGCAGTASSSDSVRKILASNATSTKAKTQSGQKGKRRKTIAKVCVYGKPEGAGTGVTLSNTHHPGLGVPIPYDPVTGVCGAVSIRGLSPNESYVFAVAAFDESGDSIGDGAGEACLPMETLNPLPLPLCWAHLSRTALALGFPVLAGQSAKEVYRELTCLGAVRKLPSGRRERSLNVECGSAGITTDLCDGWMASPLHGQAFFPVALDRCPRGVLQAFVQACFVLVDTADEEAMSKATTSGNVPLEEQVCRLTSLKRLALACEAAVLLQDWDLVPRGVWRAYHLLLPLLVVPAMGHILFQVLCHLHQCLSLVPVGGWDNATTTMLACLAYQITIKGHEIGESSAAQKTLLENGPQPELTSANGVAFKEQCAYAEGGENTPDSGGAPSQLALLEVWMGLPGYATEPEASSKLREALALSVSATRTPPGQPVGGEDKEEQENQTTLTTLEALEQVMSVAHKSPVNALELLQGDSYTSHPDRGRLLSRLCRIALNRGMGRQVVSWLAPPVDDTETEDKTDETSTDPSRVYLLNAADLEPLTVKVLEGEGTLMILPYIGSAVPQVMNKSEDAVSDSRVDGGPTGIEPTTTAEGNNTGDGVPNAEPESKNTTTSGMQNGPQGSLENLRPTPEESLQLLWLAEVEYILGIACLQLAFAAAPKPSPSSPQPPVDAPLEIIPGVVPSKATVVANLTAAAGGRRPWGYGNGPFSGISATAKDIFEQDPGGSEERAGGASVGGDESRTIEQLEDEGVAWPTTDGMSSVAVTSGDDVEESSTKDAATVGAASVVENKASFHVLLSKAIMHLARAASRARWGRCWVKTESSCGLLWNAVLSLWLSPQDFQAEANVAPSAKIEAVCRVPLGDCDARVYAKACEALLDAVDARNGCHRQPLTRGEDGVSARGSAIGSSGKSAQGGDDKMEGAGVGVSPNPPGGIGGSDTLDPLDLRWVSRFVEWGLQGMVRCRCWGVVVKVGSRLLSSTGGLHGGQRVYPLVMYAQKRLCCLASALLLKREARLAALEEGFQAAQAKRRRRKVLKAVEAKSKEEIEHEHLREPLVEAVGDARVRKQIHDHRLGTMLQSRDAYLKTKKIGISTLDDAREALAEYLSLLSVQSPEARGGDTSERGTEVSVSSTPRGTPRDGVEATADLGKSLKAVLKLYGRAVDVLRDKRERELLTEALCDLGDLYALRGRYDLAARNWTDAIDSLCSTLDSVKQWQSLFQRLRKAHPSKGGPPMGGGSLALALGGWSCLAGGTVLGKLSIFTGQGDMNGQLNLCLMAAEMFRGPLETSLPFPQRACDYTAYTPESLGGPGLDGMGLWTDDRKMSPSALYSSLMHVQGVLTAAGRWKEAFPVLAILEHIVSKVTLNSVQLARVKLARAECLMEAGFPAEAASALAAVLTGASAPFTTGDYAGRSSGVVKDADPVPPPPAPGSKGKGAAKGKKEDKGKDKKGTPPPAAATTAADGLSSTNRSSKGGFDRRELAKSGLPFYGLSPYQDHLPLDHSDNAAAVKWLIGEDDKPVEGTDADGTPGVTSRHARLLKRGLSGANPTLLELKGEHEACLVAKVRARLLLALANCSALPDARVAGEETGGGDAVLRRVRDAADTILGEVLQVVMKRVSPVATKANAGGNLDFASNGKSGAQASSDEGCLSNENNAAAEATAAHLAATAPGEIDSWAPVMAADALLLRGRLALLDGKLRVCRHHASRGLAVLLRHGHGGAAPSTAVTPRVSIMGGGGDIGSVRQGRDEQACMAFSDEQYQPWRVIQTWLELRHDLAAVALLQGRTPDAIFQIEKGLDEAFAVNEAAISGRLRRLRAQASVAEGELEQAVFQCNALASDYLSQGATALDHAAVLRLFAKIRRQQSLVYGGRACLRLLSESLEALRKADGILVSAAEEMGWIGSGALTYAQRENNVMMEDAQPRLLQALGTSFLDLPVHLPDDVGFGMVPADEDDAIAPSPLANLHFPTLRLLLAVRVSLLNLLESIGQRNAAIDKGIMASEVDEEHFNQENDSTEPIGGHGQRSDSHWLDAASNAAEETGALMRHVAHPHPAVRAHALLLIGKFRLCRLQRLRGLPEAVGHTVETISPADDFRQRLEEATSTALQAALRVSFARGGHDRRLMSQACMGLVVLYVSLSDEQALAAESNNAGGDRRNGRGGGGADISKEKLQLASHYLRLAAAISLSHRQLSVDLDSIAVEPLPPAVIAAMPRSALDELAGRGGRGPEDDPMLLTARGLLQFQRARTTETSLAAAPADLLPLTTVCQIHALLYQHAPVYREKCCIEESSLELSPTEAASEAKLDVPTGTLCVQWIWGDTCSSGGMEIGHGGNDRDIVGEDGQGLYPTRTCFILLGSVAASDEGVDLKASGGKREQAPPSIIVASVPAHKAEELKRCASQLKALLKAFNTKAPAQESIPPSVHERFIALLKDASDILRSGLGVSLPGLAALPPRGAGTTDNCIEPTVANVEGIEGIFDTEVGVHTVNEELCHFVRDATAT